MRTSSYRVIRNTGILSYCPYRYISHHRNRFTLNLCNHMHRYVGNLIYHKWSHTQVFRYTEIPWLRVTDATVSFRTYRYPKILYIQVLRVPVNTGSHAPLVTLTCGTYRYTGSLSYRKYRYISFISYRKYRCSCSVCRPVLPSVQRTCRNMPGSLSHADCRVLQVLSEQTERSCFSSQRWR